MIKALILLTTPVLIWGLSKKELLAKRFSFSQFAVNQHIDFKSSGEYQLYLENAMTPRWEQGRFKIINNVVYLKIGRAHV